MAAAGSVLPANLGPSVSVGHHLDVRFAIDLVPFGVHAEPSVIVAQAAAAEAAGWDGFFLWDHLVTDPFAVLAAIAATTTRLTLGTAVTPVPRHAPAMLARTLATIDRLSGGRLVLGAGLGTDDESASYGWPRSTKTRAAMTDEALLVVDRLMAGGSATHAGDHYALESATLRPLPLQRPRVPIWIGATTDRALQRAARWDGWVIDVSNQDGSVALPHAELRRRIELVRSLRGSESPFEVALAGITRASFSASEPAPRDAARAAIGEWEEAGATWWLELVGGGSSSESIDATRRLIESGPPR